MPIIHVSRQSIAKDSKQRYNDTEMNHLAESKNNLAFFLAGPAGQILMMEKYEAMITSRIKKKSYLVS